MRRNFYELATPGRAPIASQALKHIAELYAVEKDIRGRSAEERRLVRQQKSRPLAEAFERWLRAKLALISQKVELADAIRYPLSRWEGLTRVIDDGRIELDTNPVENAIRPICLTRKNALFAGHEVGAENWALLSSVVATCRLNDVNPVDYSPPSSMAILKAGSMTSCLGDSATRQPELRGESAYASARISASVR
ncbi:hypothetical protein JOE51_004879 [Bradyrhizobium japonicum]|uniref:Transposase IS66 central domain-containing protein n=1 Tax=Bradyrhizobium diazoefficiens TaxID=1355477 RepID=A0A809YPR9_9BRAD|nr:hypothetical protein [Bradyrhizobium japonicum]BBZ97116.1 hypothetical protein F07S3_69490 [Bradyrhizobium diazoefficiens]BCA06178.1 hypothetical protein H12S4_70820 [Bradyrhizobium diazoefficiens]BCA14805.1 hypothetical protein BDHF08_66520 [Bradyrhizobium diazoefficiens]BCA23530.1 hypothetical protein BDHH15_67450 [Bradyrhizobium diazoefficiens]